ncbi:MAG: tRNA pseudouridine(55) synthase TruB [Lachnospiraceae bacterium]|nr:tRNA pseudouridine(55) synthase TruB [Lachnospiraceae bacterium]
MDGIINIYKEKGFTSHDVVAVVRRTINQKKVGHTGTLDPEAEGVLPVCVGRGTKLADYIMAADKQYLAQLTLGVTTTTEDHMGEVIETKPVDFDEEKIRIAVSKFTGEILQIPPMYSAIKIKGKKLYELAREGKEVERASRKICIENIEIKSFTPPNNVEILVTCSKGTYIRTLCADIGKELGCGGHMSKLLRTRSGNFTLDNAITLEKLKEICENGYIESVLLPMEKALGTYNRIFVDKKADKLLHNGCKIYDYFLKNSDHPYAVGDTVTAYDSENTLVGIFTVINDNEKNKVCIKPLKILL